MIDNRHLKSEQYYSDLYDLGTVEICRGWDVKEFKEDKDDKSDLNPAAKVAMTKLASQLMIYFISGDRYAKKAETVEEWMARDREKDEYFDAAEPLELINCLACGGKMFVTDKLFHDWGPDKRNWWYYACPVDADAELLAEIAEVTGAS